MYHWQNKPTTLTNLWVQKIIMFGVEGKPQQKRILGTASYSECPGPQFRPLDQRLKT